jgi:D-alanyl-D-alanine dipeptidase
VTLPFVRVHAHHRWVDDPRSRHYNRLVDARTVERDWSSAEWLARPDGLYDAALVVDHNPPPCHPGAGSAVFVHAWRGPARPTAGCTGLDPTEVRALLAWLDPAAAPILVQLPRATYRRVQVAWRLPPLA